LGTTPLGALSPTRKEGKKVRAVNDYRKAVLLTTVALVAALILAAIAASSGLGSTSSGSAEPKGATAGESTGAVRDVLFAIHGGAGNITRQNVPPELEAQYREALTEALRRGNAIIREGGDAVDAVEAAITYLEDSPLFNAGKGRGLHD
jgi:L-asparaginase / beta-aspartyl-peptidase